MCYILSAGHTGNQIARRGPTRACGGALALRQLIFSGPFVTSGQKQTQTAG